MDRRIEWRPSSQERKSHQLPADACVVGRVIVRQVQPSNGDQPLLLALFTTLVGPPEEIVPIYGKRWNIETDLRSLKSDLRLEQLHLHQPRDGGQRTDPGDVGIQSDPRGDLSGTGHWPGAARVQLPTTGTQRVINAFGPLIAAARDPQEAQRQFENMMYYASRARLPKRRQPRSSSPRVAWGKPRTFPKPKE